MAQQTLADLVSRVQAWSNRADLADSLYIDFINIALARTVRLLRLPVMESQVVITLTDGHGELPRDYLEAIDVRVSVSGNEYSLERKDISFIQEEANYTGAPKYFGRRGTEFYIAPTSDVSEVTLYYYIVFQPLVNNTDTNWFVADAPEVLLYGALAEIALYVRDDISAAKWEAKFRAHLEEIQQMADEAQWSGSTLSVHSR